MIPKTGHIWDEGTVTKAATCTEKGIRTYTCSVCESTKIEEIPSTGHGTKIILLGDPQQIDRPFLDERTNGLSYAAKHMMNSPLCWQITLSADECERSILAMDAVKRL